jgi:hypothetical protein
MAKRSVSDDEIALIKAMLARGMKNKDIQFFFNRPDRSVNSGRITGIRKGSYGGAKNVHPASDAELDKFLAEHSGPSKVVAFSVPTAAAAVPSEPLAEISIKRLFAKGKDGIWRLTAGETDAHECKTNFGMKHPEAWLRAVAALANNSGGYILFGVHDKGKTGPSGEDLSHAVVGMNNAEFQKVDPATLAKRVKAVFDPTPHFRTTTVSIGGKSVGVMYVEQHASRPVIATKAEGDRISEGDIFFRYPGQSTRIKYSDLRAMLDARDKEARAQILPMVERLLRLGPQRSMVADLEAGTLGDGKTAIHIDASLIEKLNFIKEGQFDEIEGAPTLRLIGEVQPVDAQAVMKTKLGLLRRDDVFRVFLDQDKPEDPENYIRFAVEVGQGEWYPLHYFASLAGMSRKQLLNFISSSEGTAKRKELYAQRAQPNAAYHPAVGKPKAILAEIMKGKLPTITTAVEASHTAQAIEALPEGFAFDRRSMFSLLKQCLALLDGQSTLSFARRAIGRVDELLFADRESKPEVAETSRTATTDGPLLDLSDEAVKKMIKAAKKRGYVTMDELNAVLPSEEVTSEQIEETMSMLSDMGINVVEDREACE